MSLTLLLAEPQPLIADSLKLAFRTEPGVVMVADVRNGRDAIDEAERTSPDVALLDARLSDPDVVEVTFLIKRGRPHTRLVVFGGDEDVERLMSLFRAGADAYLTRRDGLTDLMNATHTVQSGKALLPLALLHTALGHDSVPRIGDEVLRRLSGLTLREKDILLFLCDGMASAEIAETLFISRHTVKTHVHRVLKKLGVHSRLEARALVTRHGLLGYLRRFAPTSHSS